MATRHKNANTQTDLHLRPLSIDGLVASETAGAITVPVGDGGGAAVAPGQLIRVCRECRISKPINSYHRSAGCRYGRDTVCIECRRAMKREYYRKHRGRHREVMDKWYKENAIRHAAHDVVYRAVATGNLTPQPCEVDPAHGIGHAHHDDYAKPLNVRWLCQSCHKRHHAMMRTRPGQLYTCKKSGCGLTFPIRLAAGRGDWLGCPACLNPIGDPQ
jgi:hypothetical protein